MRASLSGTLAAMGPGVPYVIGAKFAHPDRPAIPLVGDGAMQMNGINQLITIGKTGGSGATLTSKDYEPLTSYAFLSDCHSAALVSATGSIDWWCLPWFDSPSVFGAVLDPNAGRWPISPAGRFETEQRWSRTRWSSRR